MTIEEFYNQEMKWKKYEHISQVYNYKKILKKDFKSYIPKDETVYIKDTHTHDFLKILKKKNVEISDAHFTQQKIKLNHNNEDMWITNYFVVTIKVS